LVARDAHYAAAMLGKTGHRSRLAVLLALVVLGAAIAAPAEAKKKDAFTPGRYTTAPIPGAENLRSFLYAFHLFEHDAKPLRAKHRRYYLQSVAFLKWHVESAVPADGIVHWCGASVTFIEPPGLTSDRRGGLIEYHNDQPLQSALVATGKPPDWPVNAPGPMTHFSVRGKLNEKKHRIKFTGTCGGVTATRTYKLTKRFHSS
jgi:hypothetical protein